MRALLCFDYRIDSTVEEVLIPLGWTVERAASDALRAAEGPFGLFVFDWDALGAAALCAPAARGAIRIAVARELSADTISAALAAGAHDIVRLPEDAARLAARALAAARRVDEPDGAPRFGDARAEHQAFIARVADGVFSHALDGTLLEANPAFVDLLGYTAPEQVIGKNIIDDLVHPDDRDAIRARVRSIAETGAASRPRPVRFLAKGGEVRWAETRGFVTAAFGEPAFIVIARDLTERRAADEALRRSEERFAQIFHAAPTCISITRAGSEVFVDVNERFVAATGFSREELIGRTGVELGLWPDPKEREALANALRDGRPVRDVEVRLKRKSGELVDVLMSLEPISSGGEHYVFALSHDITEHKRLEEQLRRAQKMEAIGRLAGGVAHDFNNILTAIRGYGELLLEQTPSGGARGAAQHIIRSAGRAASLTEQLLVFSRRTPHEPRVVALNDVVRAMAALLRRVIGEDIELALALSPNLGRVRVDPGQMEQVIMNLAINARDAMEDGGRLTVETADAVDGEGRARVRLSVRDDGCGMSEETRLRIFEPFFTTKEVGKGTGLGLSIVYGVVEQSGGAITVETAPGAGSTFHIWLQPAEAPVESAAQPSAPRPAPRGHERVLLVEDDEDVREFVQLVLRRAGYEVLPAGDGVEALRVARSHDGEIHLLLSDVVMPQMNGRQLAEKLSTLRPEIKILYMSGYPGDSIARYGDVFHGAAFLQKPFSVDTLTGKVRAVLDA